ncbi:hypothetical protein ACCS53_39185, partial [Rhizobium ruizarguesonis]
KGYPVALATFTALVAGSAGALDFESLPVLLGVSFVGFVTAEDQTAAKRPLDHNKRLPFRLRLGIDGAPADPGKVETAG